MSKRTRESIDLELNEEIQEDEAINEIVVQSDMERDKPVIAIGKRGMSGKPFRRKFKNYAAYEKWLDTEGADDYQVSRIMNEEMENDDEEEDDQEEMNQEVKESSQEFSHIDEDENVKQFNQEIDMSEDIAALTEDENLSEEFKIKAQTIFEAAVNDKVNAIVEQKIADLEEIFQNNLTEEIESFEAELLESMDKFLNYAASQWLEENKLAVEKGIRSEIVENFIGGLKTLFEENYVDIPEEKVDLVDELFAKVESLEEELKEKTEKLVDLHEKVDSMKRNQIIEEETRGLPVVQADKIRKLAEGVEYRNVGELKYKLDILKESYTKKTQNQDIKKDDSPIYETGETTILEENDNDEEYNYVQRQYTKYLRKPNHV